MDINISPILYLLEGTGPASPNTARPTEVLYFVIVATANSSVSRAQSSLGSEFNNSFFESIEYKTLDAINISLEPG